MQGGHAPQFQLVVHEVRQRARLVEVVGRDAKVAGVIVGVRVPARSEVSRGEVLLGEIMTSPAPLTTGDAATAAAEQLVPINPATCGSDTIPSAPARPPSGEQLVSTGSPRSISRPRTVPTSSAAKAAPCRDTAASVGATVTEASMRIRTASPGSSVTAPSGPG